MKFKMLFTLCLATLAFFGNALQAQVLPFFAGSEASYTVNQKANGYSEFWGEKSSAETDATINFDIKILALDEEKLSYPFDVEVSVKKIALELKIQDEEGDAYIHYDSTENNRNAENGQIAEYLDQILGHPLTFRIESDFKITETSGYLKKVYEEYTDQDESQTIFGATPWSFELMLTQLFHLSGEDLKEYNSYDSTCFQFLNWEDEALDETEVNIKQSCHHFIKALDDEKMKAVWRGHAIVTHLTEDLKGKVDLVSETTWNMKNPLEQERKLLATIEARGTILYLPISLAMNVVQTWTTE